MSLLKYVAIPQTAANPGGEIAELNPRTQTVTRVFPLTNCTPHGLALGPHPNLLVGCNGGDLPAGAPLQSLIINITTGATIATIPQVGGSDEVWYNPGDNRYYLAASSWRSNGVTGGAASTVTPVLGIIDAGTNTWVANVETAINAHSVAVDPVTNAVFVPFRNGTVAVFARGALTPAAAPVSTSGGGGCALSPGTTVDPTLVSLLGLMVAFLVVSRLRRRRGNASTTV